MHGGDSTLLEIPADGNTLPSPEKNTTAVRNHAPSAAGPLVPLPVLTADHEQTRAPIHRDLIQSILRRAPGARSHMPPCGRRGDLAAVCMCVRVSGN